MREDLIIEFNYSLLRLHRGGIDVQFCWEPAHEGVKGNEAADNKTSLQKEITLPVSPGKGEFKTVIKRKGTDSWQKTWEEEQKGRTYFRIQKSVRTKKYKERSRREEVMITRLRLDHTGLNSTLALMGKRNSDKCETCDVKENVKNIYQSTVGSLRRKGRDCRIKSEKRDGTGI